MLKQTRPIPMKVRAANDEKAPVIEAYFAVFGSPYNFGPGVYETVDPAAFDECMNDDIRALINHDSSLVLGRTSAKTLELKVDSKGLWGRIHINPDDVDAMNLYARVKRGDVSSCSFGFEVLDEESVYEESTGKIHWIIKRVKLWEVSVVTFPAYEATVAQARNKSNELYEQRKREELASWKARMRAKLKKNTKG